jgi:hypothetical protein
MGAFQAMTVVRFRHSPRCENQRPSLERFHKCCSGVLLVVWSAVFLIFGFRLAKNQKSSLHTTTSFLSTL